MCSHTLPRLSSFFLCRGKGAATHRLEEGMYDSPGKEKLLMHSEVKLNLNNLTSAVNCAHVLYCYTVDTASCLLCVITLF